MRYTVYRNRLLKCIALMVSLCLAGSLMVNEQTLAYLTTKTRSFINTFISGLAPEGGIIIQKTVEHPFGENYQIPQDVAFTFKVELGPDHAGKELSTTQGEMTADENGVILVSVRPGEPVIIRNILIGTVVTVTELQELPGFQVKDGEVSKTVLVVSRANEELSFVNTYTPAPAKPTVLTVDGVKELVGREWQKGDSFTLQMDYRFMGAEDTQWTKLGTRTVKYQQNSTNFNCFDFSELVQGLAYDKTGIYAFRVFELEGSIGGVTYDNTISYFDVTVGDADMDGMLEIQKVSASFNATAEQEQDLFRVALRFKNTYAPSGSAEVVIPIFKSVDDLSGQNTLPAGFTFELYDKQGNLLQTTEPTSAAGESCVKLVYSADSVGQSFSYLLKETYGGQTKAGMIFDSTEHEITVSVVDNLDGTIGAVANVTEVLFVNVYDPEDAVIYVGGLKKLDGAELKKGMFSFALHQANENFELMNVIQTTSNNADGTFVFEKLYCPTVGVFYFAVTEDASNPLEGMTYDKSVYGLKVTVTDDGNGQLSASVDVTEVGNPQNAEIVFENIYEPVEQPTDSTKPSKPDSPGTGDQPSLARYYVLTAVSVLLLWLVCKQYKRPEEN